METPRILILDDSPMDADLAVRELRRGGLVDECTVVHDRKAFQLALEQERHDLVVTDYSLPDMDAFESLRMVEEKRPGTPVIIYTGSVNEETAIGCMKAGAVDYVLKSHMPRLVPACAMALTVSRERRERRSIEAALRESERRLRTLVETAHDAIVSANQEGKIVFWNPGAELAFGYTSGEAIGLPLTDLMPERYRSAHLEAFGRQAASTDVPMSVSGVTRLVALRRDGTEFGIELSLARTTNDGRSSFHAIIRDISERDASRSAIESLSHLHEAILTSAGEGIMGVDRQGRATFVNPAGLRLAGRTEDELLGQLVHPLLHHTDEEGYPLPEADCPLLAVLSDGRPFAGRLLFWKKDGTSFPVQLSAMPMMGDGEFTGAVVIFEDVTEQERAIARSRKAKDALRLSEAKYRSLVENATLGIYRSTPKDLFVSGNPALVRMLGYDSLEEVLALTPGDLYENPVVRDEAIESLGGQTRIDSLEVRWKRKDGKPILVRLSGQHIRDEATGEEAFEFIAEDISERRALEDQLRQAQKMEAVGQLTSGIAHDFNNVLCVISLSAQLASAAVAAGRPVDPEDLQGIEEAARRAAKITQQLLGFSRRAELAVQPVNLAGVVKGLSAMLRTALPETIRIEVRADTEVGMVQADPSSVEQMILNLVTNSRDAMPQGGSLAVEVSDQDLDDLYCERHQGMTPGRYVCIEVSDNGAGMTAEVQSRVFEPFFTTKPVGAGTGLGLAMVYGLAKQQGGGVWVYSEPGEGTAVKVYFPTIDDSPRGVAEAAATGSGSLGGTETILLVEDEPDVRAAGVRALGGNGYTVLTAENGEEALATYKEHMDGIDLVVSDMIMPKMGGRPLLDALRAENPALKVILASGYTRGEALGPDQPDRSVPFLRKPWDLQSLLSVVRRTLDSDVADDTSAKEGTP